MKPDLSGKAKPQEMLCALLRIFLEHGGIICKQELAHELCGFALVNNAYESEETMKLYLSGHNYKYAVEQMLLTLFPTERPEYSDCKVRGDGMDISLHTAARNTTAVCVLHLEGKRYLGRAQTANESLAGELQTDRASQRLIKNAMYRAALSAGHCRPAWGALTGVRPGKLMKPMLEHSASEEEALHRFISEYDVSERRAKLCLATTKETVSVSSFLTDRDVCLYVGIPFCPTRCAYCSFVSQSVEKSMKLIPPFLTALEREIEASARQVRELGLRVVSLYMGGGTPTTLSAKQLDTLCLKLEKEFDLSSLREYTVEAGRPDTISVEKLNVLRRHGVDRVSVNPQTMSDEVLKLIGRRHTAADIEQALAQVRSVGGFAVNMDLIAGLPGDDIQGFTATLEKVLTLGTENITVHTLSLKKGSSLTLDASRLPTGEEVSAMLDYAEQRLSASGYSPYYLYRQKFMSGGFENVGWAREGKINLYNICIMEELCSIIALGGGGSTKLIRPDDGKNIRIITPKYPLEYINAIDRICEDKNKIAVFYNNFLNMEDN